MKLSCNSIAIYFTKSCAKNPGLLFADIMFINHIVIWLIRRYFASDRVDIFLCEVYKLGNFDNIFKKLQAEQKAGRNITVAFVASNSIFIGKPHQRLFITQHNEIK